MRRQPAPEFLVPVAQTATEEALDWELTSLAARDPHGAHVSYAAVQPGSDVSAGGLYATGRSDGQSGTRNEEEHNHAGALDLSLQMQVGLSSHSLHKTFKLQLMKPASVKRAAAGAAVHAFALCDWQVCRQLR